VGQHALSKRVNTPAGLERGSDVGSSIVDAAPRQRRFIAAVVSFTGCAVVLDRPVPGIWPPGRLLSLDDRPLLMDTASLEYMKELEAKGCEILAPGATGYGIARGLGDQQRIVPSDYA